ncbi:MAG: hypothetical protein JETT_1505 [Candidatus Jettenia ecosi]|uniref:Spore protein YkvP/CgeB glycosyl transferase-like domain-containing protein n=1 Tax=Candidatus Jettenia ecosi TaxID=2494326 RepID=A0A533QC64_9BACT|nr:MAG: hypothetical protein JETT_1505 [Candidatus Jettenia ecosi]
MKIGFYIKWSKGSLNSNSNVLGDELYGESICHALRKVKGIKFAELYAPNYLPNEELDVMIYLNGTKPNDNWAKRHISYMQNAYGEGSDKVLEEFQKIGYDGYAFISKKLLSMHKNSGFSGIFLPFGVDLDTFYPRKAERKYTFEVAYIGNDIKGECRTTKYLFPAVKYNFGLFGNWEIPKARLRFWKNWRKVSEYKRIFQKISQGKIPQEKVPVLYSNAKINLNCTAQDCVNWDVITLRTFEVLACKGFLITDRVAVAEETMKDCMVFTEGDEDLAEKIEYYLSHENERKIIAENGYEYVIKHASIEKRVKELYSYIEEII